MNRARVISLVLFAMLGHGAAALRADDVSVEAKLDKHNCVLGDSVLLSISVSGVEKPPEPQIPEIADVEVRSLGSSSQAYISTSFVNGKVQKTATQIVVFNFRLTPKKLGQYAVPEIPFTTGAGRKLDTAAQTFACVKATDQDYVILDVTANKTDVYQYEAVQITLKLYIRDASRLIKGYQLDLDCLREVAGFIRAEADDPDERLKQFPETERNGKLYDVYSTSRMFFPESPGEKTVPVATMNCRYAKEFRPRSRSPFRDPFFDDVFGSRLRAQDVQQVFARSNELKINVRPLPKEGRPEGFGGAVGQYELDAEISRNTAKVGDPITLTTTVSGTGYAGSITAPTMASTDGFKIYEDDTKTEEKRSGNTVRVTKLFQTICEPQSADVKAIPAVTFHYFDPKTAKYVTLNVGPLPITVSPMGRESPARVAIQAVVAPPGQTQVLKGDIRPIVTSAAELRNQRRLIYREPWFLVSLIVPLLVAAGCAVVQQRREKFRTDEAFARGKQAMRTARRRLADAGKMLAEGSAKEFHAILFRAVTEYIGDKLNISPASVTSQAVSGLLSERKVRAELIAEAESCLRECEHGRFSAESKEGERDFLKRTTALLKKLGRAIR